jgi:hypothetical protein
MGYIYAGMLIQKWKQLLNFLKDSNIRTTYSAVNTTESQINTTAAFTNAECLDCPLKCVEQTGRKFCTRHKEHILVIRSNRNDSR